VTLVPAVTQVPRTSSTCRLQEACSQTLGPLRQGAELDEQAQQILAQAHRPPEPADTEPEPHTADAAAQADRLAEATGSEPEADDGPEIEPG